MDDVEDVGDQRRVGCLVPRQGLEQLACARHGERQDQPVRLGEGEGVFGCRVRGALVAEGTVGERGQQLGFDDRDVPDDRCRAVEDVGQHAERSGRIALGEADHRPGIAELARVRLLVSEGRERGADIPGYIEASANALDYSWSYFIGGHLGRLGTRDDVRLHQQYMADISESSRKAIDTVDPTPYFVKYGANTWAALKGYLDEVTAVAAAPVIEKYTRRAGSG